MTSPQESVVPKELETGPPITPADYPDQLAKMAVDLAIRAMNAPTPEFSPLSPRQTQVIELISLGLTDKQIAKELNIAFESVRSFSKQIYKKIGAKNRSHAVYRTFEEGVLQRKEEIEVTQVRDLGHKEYQVLQLIAEGHTDKEIALERGRGVETIKSQVRKILEKLGTNDRTNAVKVAIEADVLPIHGDEVKNRRKILESASFLMALAFAGEEHNGEDEDSSETKPRSGMYLDWAASTLMEFQGRTLAINDIAKVVYADDFEHDRRRVNTRTNALLSHPQSRGALKERLSQLGFKFSKTHVKSRYGKQVRVICLPLETELNPEDIDESTRPTDGEIKQTVAKIRHDEISYRQQKIEDKAKRTAQEELEKQERDDNTPPGRLTVFLNAHRNQPFPIAELVPVAFPDSEESSSVLKQKISKIINEGTVHDRLDGREASLHKASFKPEGHKWPTVVLVSTDKGEPSQWILELEADQERKKRQREINQAWSEHGRQVKESEGQSKEKTRSEIRDWQVGERLLDQREQELWRLGIKLRRQERTEQRAEPEVFERQWRQEQDIRDREREVAQLAKEIALKDDEKTAPADMAHLVHQVEQELVDKWEREKRKTEGVGQKPLGKATNIVNPPVLPPQPERRRRASWEGDFETVVVHSAGLLRRAGAFESGSETQPKVPINNPTVLQEMFEHDLISADQLKAGELDLAEAVRTMVFGTENGKKVLLDPASRDQALKIIDDEIVARYRMHFAHTPGYQGGRPNRKTG